MLEEALRRHSLTQSAFARQVCVPRSVLSEVIRGRRKPPKTQAVRWMTALEIPASERLTWRRAIALARADPLLAEWIVELEVEIAQLRQVAEGHKRPGKGLKP
jgi:transcriptional regulator with XRE-family HTH domain